MLLADTLLDLIRDNTVPAVINAAVLGIIGGGIGWATAFYRRAVSIDANVKKLNENMQSALKRIDDHESRIRSVEITLAKVKER